MPKLIFACVLEVESSDNTIRNIGVDEYNLPATDSAAEMIRQMAEAHLSSNLQYDGIRVKVSTSTICEG